MTDLPTMPDNYRPGFTVSSGNSESTPAPDWLVEKAKQHYGKGVSTNPDDLPPKATVEEIKAALAVIPADCSEEEWWRVGAALYDELGEGGFDMFHEWSATGGASYKGEHDCRNKWRYSAKKKKIRIATLFHIAKQYDENWRDGVKGAPPPLEEGKRPEPEAKAEGPSPPEWPILGEAAYYGLAGKIVRTIEPHTEGDPVAIIVQLLVAVGSAAGRNLYVQIESTRHHANLFAAIVGDTAIARKGTSLGRVLDVMYSADSGWRLKCVSDGLSSGEGLIDRIRDRRTKINNKTGEEEEIDAGVEDKRLAVIESELASILSVMERGGNTISPVIRKAWDGGDLAIMTRKNPVKATAPHVSVIGHITVEELRSCLTRTDAASGFANRFLFILARRSKLLPMGGSLSSREVADLGREVRECLAALFDELQVRFSEAAERRWVEVYPELTEARPGMLGAVIARGSAQVLRIALVYAILDAKTVIEVEHIEAALAIWRYAEESARRIFGDMLGDNTADTILVALKQVHPAGLNRTEINGLFSHNVKAVVLSAALESLKRLHLARFETDRPLVGRPTETWFYTPRRA